jgi:hypothetical protein
VTTAAFLAGICLAGAPSMEIRTHLLRVRMKIFWALLGENGDTPSLTDPDGGVRVRGGGGSMTAAHGGRDE